MMNSYSKRYLSVFTAFIFLFFININSLAHDDHADDKSENLSVHGGIDLDYFKQGTFIQEPEIVDCTTSAGRETSCYKLVTLGAPTGRLVGNFCPRKISDGAEEGGAWFDKSGEGKLVDLTGEFIANLAEYYDDPNWKLADQETGKIRYTETKEACLGAAKPDVEEQYKQNCIECLMSYLEEGFSRTFMIPVEPVIAEQNARVRTVGIALDGSELSGPAPIDAILGSYTIAAFDDCGGHINEHQGYHYHSVTGCTNNDISDDGYAPLVGYAADGFPIYAWKDSKGNEAKGLDECRGISDSIRGYHYRANSPSSNAIIPCLRGESVNTRSGPRPPRD